MSSDDARNETKSSFEELGQEKPPTLVQEFYLFIVENKKWWLAPILIVLLALGTLAMLGGSGVAPFISRIEYITPSGRPPQIRMTTVKKPMPKMSRASGSSSRRTRLRVKPLLRLVASRR